MSSNYDHENPTLLKIGGYGGDRYMPKDDYTDTSTALTKPVDLEGITRDAMASNTAMVTALLKQYATTAPTGDRNPQVTGISSRDELSARNERFRWTTVEVVVLVAITAAGIVLVAQRQMELDAVATIAGWLVLSGLGGVASATWVSHQESRLTPESIERERVAGDYDIAATDAESRQMIARAFATSIENDSETKRAYAEAQRAANQSLLERSKPITAPQRAQPTRYDDSYDYADETPQCAPESPSLATWNDGETAGLMVAPTIAPDKDLVAMLSHVEQLYNDCDQRDSDIITLKLQWRNRGDWDADASEKAERVLAYFADNYNAPLVFRGNENGARWRLNRQAWKRNVARAIIAREWGNN